MFEGRRGQRELTEAGNKKAETERSRRRRQTIAQHGQRCRLADPKLWWSLQDVFDALHWPAWFPQDQEQRFCQEFFEALKGGVFDRDGKTRVALLDSRNDIIAALEQAPSPQLRLTSSRAQRILEGRDLAGKWGGPLGGFWGLYSDTTLIEIDLADIWLATWLDSIPLESWRRNGAVLAALRAAVENRRHRPQQTPAPRNPATVSAGLDIGLAARRTGGEQQPFEPAMPSKQMLNEKATQWLAEQAAPGGRLAEEVAAGRRVTKQRAFELAHEKFGASLSKTQFYNVVWPTAPAPWHHPGAPRKHRPE